MCKYEPRTINADYLAECEIHAEVLKYSLLDSQKCLPFSIKVEIDKDALRILDQIAYRFAKLQDSMGEKVSPLILVLAQEPVAANATFVEKLNRLERIGAIPSAEGWKKLRVSRNAIAHEYPDDPEMRISAINRFMAGASQMSVLHQSVQKYINMHFPGIKKQGKKLKPITVFMRARVSRLTSGRINCLREVDTFKSDGFLLHHRQAIL